MPDRFHVTRPHPWHGLEPGIDPPRVVHAYIEITPFDSVKYEVDKHSGYLKVDRPQRTTSQPPALYGFIPRTYCGPRVRDLSPTSRDGDHDPLDICVISERPISRAEVILDAAVIGGLQMVDAGEADDKIIAVLTNDNIWGDAKSITGVPKVLIDRFIHYFGTYKVTGDHTDVKIESVYDRDHAMKVIEASMEDYQERFVAHAGMYLQPAQA